MQSTFLLLIGCVRALIDMKSTSSKLQPSFKITWRCNTKGREPYDLNRETYEDVITLAVKHLGMGIRPNAFAMLACAQCFGGKQEGRNELEHIRWRKKKKEESHQQSLLESANRYTRSCFLLI